MKTSLKFLFLILLADCKNDNLIQPQTKVADPSSASVIKLRATVNMLVGEVYYQNCDAVINVKGFDSSGVQNYSEDIPFTGPYDTISISAKSVSYAMDLTLWGNVHSNYDQISFTTLWGDRIDGPSPVTYGFGGNVAAKKLKRTEEYFLGSDGAPVSGTQEEYQYTPDGKLDKIIQSSYSAQTSSFTPTGRDEFVYSGPALNKINRFFGTTLIEEYVYSGNVGFYRPGAITKNSGGYNDVAQFDFAFEPGKPAIKIEYTVSANNTTTNIIYTGTVDWKTITTTREIKENELCNEGQFTYDKYINPFRHLGYLDYYAGNFSANNTVSESVNYYSCGVPDLQPTLHTYTYDGGFPVIKETIYKAQPPYQEQRKSKMYYYYY